jgi:hypothetical protein
MNIIYIPNFNKLWSSLRGFISLLSSWSIKTNNKVYPLYDWIQKDIKRQGIRKYWSEKSYCNRSGIVNDNLIAPELHLEKKRIASPDPLMRWYFHKHACVRKMNMFYNQFLILTLSREFRCSSEVNLTSNSHSQNRTLLLYSLHSHAVSKKQKKKKNPLLFTRKIFWVSESGPKNATKLTQSRPKNPNQSESTALNNLADMLKLFVLHVE